MLEGTPPALRDRSLRASGPVPSLPRREDRSPATRWAASARQLYPSRCVSARPAGRGSLGVGLWGWAQEWEGAGGQVAGQRAALPSLLTWAGMGSQRGESSTDSGQG